MFFTDVNKFTLTCDLNFQKKKDRRKEERRGEWERKERRENQIGRKEGSFKVIPTQVTSVKGFDEAPQGNIQKELLAYVFTRRWTWEVNRRLPFDAFFTPSCLFIFILRVDFKLMQGHKSLHFEISWIFLFRD